MSHAILISGVCVKIEDSAAHTGHSTFEDIDIYYHVMDEVSHDDVEYYIRRAGLRVIPIRTDGTKLDGVIVSKDKDSTRPGKPLGRIAFGKQITKDLKEITR